MASKAITKVAKSTSSASKADQKRSGKHNDHEAVNPYAPAVDNNEDDAFVDGASATNFINFQSKDLNFEDFLDVLNDKHQRDAAIECLFARKLKSFNIQQPPITPDMADQLLGGIRSALGLGAGAGKKGGKKTSSDGVPSLSVATARTVAVQCGTALVVCCGQESKQLFDEWGAALMTTVVGIFKGLRSQMEEYIHTSNIQEGPVKIVLASPSGITSSASAAQRKALSEIAGKCTGLLTKCFEGLALLYSLDPNMSVNEDHESLPAALLKLANLVIPDSAATTSAQMMDSFPTADNQNSFYLPVEASGALLVCLASCCEPAQGPKTRAAILRLHRFVTRTTVTAQDDDADSATNDTADGGDHKTNYMGLVSTIVVALVQSIGILGTRFPDMVAPDTDVSIESTPTGAFTSTPLLSVDLHLVPLLSMFRGKAMAKGKGRRETQALLRQAAKKLGSLNGSNIDSIEEHEKRHQKRPAPRSQALSTEGSPTTRANNKFPVIVSPSRERPSEDYSDSLPSENPNRAAARDEEDADEEEFLNTSDAAAQVFDGADPVEVVQFRDNLSVKFVGFQKIYLSECLRSITTDGLQRQLAQNPAVRAALNVTEDLNRKLEKGERREQIAEAEASKAEEYRDRQKDRDRKAMAREYSDHY